MYPREVAIDINCCYDSVNLQVNVKDVLTTYGVTSFHAICSYPILSVLKVTLIYDFPSGASSGLKLSSGWIKKAFREHIFAHKLPGLCRD